jgi:hypothetical protein
LRSYDLPVAATDAIDWLTMASLRNSEDLHFNSTAGTISGPSGPAGT